MRTALFAFLAISLLTVSACTLSPHFIPIVKKQSDYQLSCHEIKSELGQIELDVQELMTNHPPSKTRWAYGVVGISWPGNGIAKLSTKEKDMLRAYRQRYEHLSKIAHDKGCEI